MKSPVHPESETAEFSSFVSCVFWWLVLNQNYHIHMYF